MTGAKFVILDETGDAPESEVLIVPGIGGVAMAEMSWPASETIPAPPPHGQFCGTPSLPSGLYSLDAPHLVVLHHGLYSTIFPSQNCLLRAYHPPLGHNVPSGA
jgi:hypothetical protein